MPVPEPAESGTASTRRIFPGTPRSARARYPSLPTCAFRGAEADPPAGCRTPACPRPARPGDHQVQFVDQSVGQQVVPERAAAEDQDVFAGLAFEFGDLLVSVCPANYAGVVPWLRLIRGEGVGHDHLVYGVVEAAISPARWVPRRGPQPRAASSS